MNFERRKPIPRASSRSRRSVDLTHAKLASAGSRRLVFEHPDDPDLLIKVMKPGSYHDDGQPLRSKFYKVRKREGVFAYFVREIAEYVAVRIACAPYGPNLPISAVYGIAETSLGLGLVVEKITDRWGNLAPTLRDLVERGEFDESKERALEEFLDMLADDHVVIYELSVDNIVFSESDGARFVCVDGMGTRTLIPVHAWWKAANTRSIRKLEKRLRVQIEEIQRSLRRQHS